MITKMYYDAFEGEYVLEDAVNREITAPPERFIPVYRGDSIYIERWIVESECGDRLDIAYTKDEYRDLALRKEIRYAQAERNHCKLIQLHSWTIPSDMFDKRAEMFGLERRNNGDY